MDLSDGVQSGMSPHGEDPRELIRSVWNATMDDNQGNFTFPLYKTIVERESMRVSESGVRQTRRGFLLTTGLGLGGLTLVPRCFVWGQGQKLAKVSLAIVSDTHLGYQDKEHAARQWEQTAAEIGQSPAELVLHLGDVVDGGREAQYPVYLKIREKIGKPVHEIPGNHDPQSLFEKHIRKPVDTVVEHKWLRFLLLNNSRTDSHDGFLSGTQLAWIEAQCREAKQDGKYVALCMHVPAHTNRHPDRGWYVK